MDESKTLAEIKAAKLDLCGAIGDAVFRFYRETGIIPDSIECEMIKGQLSGVKDEKLIAVKSHVKISL